MCTGFCSPCSTFFVWSDSENCLAAVRSHRLLCRDDEIVDARPGSPARRSRCRPRAMPSRACAPRERSRDLAPLAEDVEQRADQAGERQALYHCCHSGRVKRIATAAKTSTTPSQPRSPRTALQHRPLTAPPFAVDRLGRQEQSERDEAQVIHHVLRVDDARARSRRSAR